MKNEITDQMSDALEELSTSNAVGIGWDVALLVVLIYTLFALPGAALFKLEKQYLFLAPDIVISLLFALDSYLLRKKGKEIYSLRPSKPMAILSAIPIYSVLFAVGLGGSWFPLVTANHLLRLNSLSNRFKFHTKNTFFGKGFKFKFVAVITALVLHWLACIWVYLHPATDTDNATQYIEALYWAITTLTTVGYGDVTPEDNLTKIFTMFVMLGGVLFYGIVIGQVSRAMVSSDKRKESQKEQLDALAALVRHYQIPPALANETYKFYRHHLTQAENENEQKILSSLPSSLESEIRTYMAIKPISTVKLFSGCSHQCLVDTAEHLETVFYSPGDRIIKKGEPGNAMFVIAHGQIVVHSGETVVIELREGHCFGEAALIEDRETRNADVSAKAYCHLLRLSKESFIQLMHRHEDLRSNASKLVKRHIRPNDVA